ncbi:RDD family protein [Salinactinospora qingdaonensis]|uniref:RDD domain-containing protein n=1 Tax=Salinactinospora qingdaonensis TaxID=702744 RepID=A0ABP7FWZ2_9ACTN
MSYEPNSGQPYPPPHGGYAPAPGYGPPPGYSPAPGYGPAPAPVPPAGYVGGPGYQPVGGSPPRPTSPPYLASWGARAAAYLVDSVLMLALVFLIFATGMTFSFEVFEEDSPWMVLSVFTMIGLVIFVPFAYFWLLHAHNGQTVGKLALGIKVISLRTGAPPGLGGSAGRQLVHMTLATVGILGWLLDGLWPLWDEPNRQALHDKAVSTYVVRTRGDSAYPY